MHGFAEYRSNRHEESMDAISTALEGSVATSSRRLPLPVERRPAAVKAQSSFLPHIMREFEKR
jgi:hypothetical protein